MLLYITWYAMICVLLYTFLFRQVYIWIQTINWKYKMVFSRSEEFLFPFEFSYIPERFLKKAEEELKETNESRQDGIEQLRDMIISKFHYRIINLCTWCKVLFLLFAFCYKNYIESNVCSVVFCYRVHSYNGSKYFITFWIILSAANID